MNNNTTPLNKQEPGNEAEFIRMLSDIIIDSYLEKLNKAKTKLSTKSKVIKTK